MKLSLLLFLFLIHNLTFSQKTIDEKLKNTLDSLIQIDQKYRSMLGSLSQKSRDSLAIEYHVNPSEIEITLLEKQSKYDFLNILYIDSIISIHGYPGLSLVGEITNEVAWYLIQHSDKIEYYYPIIKQAAKNKEISDRLSGMMYDRLLMSQNKCQMYGSQAICHQNDKGELSCIIWTIKNPRKVNKRRRKIGFELTVEENAKRLGIEYKKVKLRSVINKAS